MTAPQTPDPVAPPEEASALPDVTVPLCRAPLWRGGPNVASAAAVALFLVCLAEMLPRLWRGREPHPESLLLLALASLWLAGLGFNFARRAWVRRRPMPPVVFAADAVWLPAGPESVRTRRVRYEDILTVGQAERAFLSPPWTGSRQAGVGSRRLRAWQHYFVESRRGVYSLPQPMFVEADGHDRFFAELQRRIAALPQGPAALLDTERRRLPALAAMGRKPMATQALFGVAAVFYLNTWLKGALSTPFGLLRWGAMAPALLGRPEEAYRIFAATFLHGQWPHALVNALALRSLGTLTERLLGWPRMVLIFLVSGAVAMGASAWASEALMSVGASGALFGLLGAFAVLNSRLGSALPMGVRQPWPWWALLLGVNGGLSALVPVLDWVAHLAGFATGAVLGLALLGRRRELPPAAGPWLRGVTLAVVAVYAAALCQAVARVARTRTGEAQVAQLLSHDARTPAATLNHFALYWAIDPHSSNEHLAAGRACAEQAVHRAPQVADYRATLAELERRLGEREAACTDWRRAVTLAMQADPAPPGLQPTSTLTAFYAAQLAHNWTQTLGLNEASSGQSAAAAVPAVAQGAPAAPPPAGPSPSEALGAQPAPQAMPQWIRRDGASWTVPEVPALTGFGHRLWVVAGRGALPVALLVVDVEAEAGQALPLPSDLRATLQDCGAVWAALVDVEALPGASKNQQDATWRAFRLPPPRDADD